MTPQQKYDSFKSDFQKVADQLQNHSAHVSIYQVRAWRKLKSELKEKLEALKVQIKLIEQTEANKKQTPSWKH